MSFFDETHFSAAGNSGGGQIIPNNTYCFTEYTTVGAVFELRVVGTTGLVAMADSGLSTFVSESLDGILVGVDISSLLLVGGPLSLYKHKHTGSKGATVT